MTEPRGWTGNEKPEGINMNKIESEAQMTEEQIREWASGEYLVITPEETQELASALLAAQKKIAELEEERQELEAVIKDLNSEIGKAYNAGKGEGEQIGFEEGARFEREQK